MIGAKHFVYIISTCSVFSFSEVHCRFKRNIGQLQWLFFHFR